MSSTVRRLNSYVPEPLRQRLLWLPDSGRAMGIFMAAAKGTGKSRLLGRILAWQDFIRGKPLVIFDPNAGTLSNFLDKIARLPASLREKALRRIVYVDMSGASSHIVPFPIYYRLGQESWESVAQRFPEVVRKLDPSLQSASIIGFNALQRTAKYTGMVLAAAGLQITEAEDLIRNPLKYEGLLNGLARQHPELAPAVAFFTEELPRASGTNRSMRVDSFLNKVNMFNLDPQMQAMFGASDPGLSWDQVAAENLTVILDFSRELSFERIKFKMAWAFSTLLEFVKSRGPGRHKPVSIIIDELSYLLGMETAGHNPMADDFDELLNRLSRNNAICLTLACQEIARFDKTTRQNLLTMGTQIYGATTDPATAIEIARRFYRYDPQRVKKYEPVYDMRTLAPFETRTVEMTAEEQRLLNSYRLLDLRRYHFLVGVATAEGTMPTTLTPLSIERLDAGQYVQEKKVGALREKLAQQSGRPIKDILEEIAARRGGRLLTVAAEPVAPTKDAPIKRSLRQ